MAKDAKGHGSNAKGASVARPISAKEQRSIDMALKNRADFAAAQKAAKGKPAEPRAKLFKDSPKTKREVESVARASIRRGDTYKPRKK